MQECIISLSSLFISSFLALNHNQKESRTFCSLRRKWFSWEERRRRWDDDEDLAYDLRRIWVPQTSMLWEPHIFLLFPSLFSFSSRAKCVEGQPFFYRSIFLSLFLPQQHYSFFFFWGILSVKWKVRQPTHVTSSTDVRVLREQGAKRAKRDERRVEIVRERRWLASDSPGQTRVVSFGWNTDEFQWRLSDWWVLGVKRGKESMWPGVQ